MVDTPMQMLEVQVSEEQEPEVQAEEKEKCDT
jgi:hypothetical protein